MANNFRVDFDEIFNDSDSDSEFEGFNESDFDGESDIEMENRLNDDFLMENWREGDREPNNFDFSGNPGLKPNINLPQSPTASDFLDLFINEDDFREMANQTNIYARAYLDRNRATLKPHSRFHKWKETNFMEMKLFVGLILAQGLVVQNDLSEYWTTDEVNQTPFFPKWMSRDRYWLLMSFFHLADNEQLIPRGQEGHDPLYKCGSLYKNIVHRFASVYVPSEHLSLDEGMIPWRGNLSFKVYNPDKPKKYGIKAYEICDASNGYATKFKLYTGKSNIEPSEFGLTYDLVMDMMSGYFNKGYKLFIDNYYSSPRLLWDLEKLNVGVTGTLRANRKGVPQSLKDTPCKVKGDKCTMHNNNLMIMKFHDRKMVHVISTLHRSNDVATGKRNPNTQAPITKPEAIVYYNKYMGGVDRSDQMISYSTFNAKTLKWWKRVIFYVISLAVLNAYLQFRKKLVRDLVHSIDITQLPNGIPNRPQEPRNPMDRLAGKHFPQKIVGTGKKTNITRACAVCEPAERKLLARAGVKRKRSGKESSYQCHLCKVALCIDPCFRFYHTYKDFEGQYLRHKAGQETSDSDSD